MPAWEFGSCFLRGGGGFVECWALQDDDVDGRPRRGGGAVAGGRRRRGPSPVDTASVFAAPRLRITGSARSGPSVTLFHRTSQRQRRDSSPTIKETLRFSNFLRKKH